jgi:pimeloyl-ACP methyl ester carboxylesterase
MRARTLVQVLAVLVLLGAATAAASLAPRSAAIRCLTHFESEVPPDHDEGAPPPAGYRLLADEKRFGARRAWVRGGGAEAGRPQPCLVFVHGVAPEGIDDGRILRAIEAFHAGGFCVVAPEIGFLVDPTLRDDDEDRLVTLLRAVAAGAVEGADTRRIGVVGISVGGAFALKACARLLRGGGEGPAAVLAIGCPADIRRPVEGWYARGNPAAENQHGLAWERDNAAAFARSYGARAALRARFGPSEDAARLQAWLEADVVPEAAPAGLETDEARAYAAMVLAGPAAWTAARDRLLEDAWDQLRFFSPAAWSDELPSLAGVAVFLLHGEADPLVGIDELAALEALLAAHTLVSPLRSRLVGHTSVGPAELDHMLDHLVFMESFFDAVKR